MIIDLQPLKRGQWRAQLQEYKPVASNLGEFKTKLGGEVITGFTKHRPNGRMKVYEDSNGDGRFSKGDELLSKGMVEKDFRRADNPLEAFEVGEVKQGLKRLVTDSDPVGFGVIPTLDFKNSDGDLIGRFNLLQAFPFWEGGTTCS